MANFTQLLQQEIRRIARREAKAMVDPLHETIRKLKKEVRDLTAARQAEASQRRLKRRAENVEAAIASADQTDTQRRWSASRMRVWRERMGLSAKDVAQLLAVSQQTIYNWEADSTRPDEVKLARIAVLKKMGKRELTAALAAAEPAD